MFHVRVAAPFGEKAACDHPCPLHALKGGDCKLAGTLPRSESSCHFRVWTFAFGNVFARSTVYAELMSKAVDAWRSRLSGRGVDYGGVDFCLSQASGVDF